MKYSLVAKRSSLLFALALCGAALPLLATATLLHAQAPGDQDTSFVPGPDADGSAFALALQPDGQVLVGGNFDRFRGTGRNGIARLHPDGSLDAFNPGLAISSGSNAAPTVGALALQPDGKVLATGLFTVAGQQTNNGVVRLSADGSLDSSFNVGAGVIDAGGVVGQGYALALLPNGQILVGGSFTAFNGAAVAGLVRLNADGSLDRTFNPGGTGITRNDYGEDVRSIVVQPDGRILIGGHFSAYDGQTANCVARLNADGTFDGSLNVGEGADYGVNTLALQGDGRVLVGGGFNDFDGFETPHIVRLNTDGSLDTSYFINGGLFIIEVDTIVVQPDGTALIGGAFLAQGGLVNTPHNGVARVLADGTQDGGFNSGTNSRQARALVLQPDGKALVVSNVYALVGVATGNVSRVFDVPPPTPVVNIVAGMSKVNENGSTGAATFIANISQDPSVKTVVKYEVDGSGVAGLDYVPLTGKIKFKPGKTSVTIAVTPIDRGITNGGKAAVKLTLLPGNGFVIGESGTAKIKIFDND